MSHRFLVHDSAGAQHFRANLSAEVCDLHYCDLPDGSCVAAIEPSSNFLTQVKSHPEITVFPPVWRHTPLSPAQVALLAYAGTQSGASLYDALHLLHEFHGFPPFHPDMF